MKFFTLVSSRNSCIWIHRQSKRVKYLILNSPDPGDQCNRSTLLSWEKVTGLVHMKQVNAWNQISQVSVCFSNTKKQYTSAFFWFLFMCRHVGHVTNHSKARPFRIFEDPIDLFAACVKMSSAKMNWKICKDCNYSTRAPMNHTFF